MQAFRLIPYPADELPQILITGDIERCANRLFIRYVVTGDVDSIFTPAPSNSPARKDDLWKATCFEFFLAVKDQPPYWEFNMSPSGDWNVYAMDAYRQVNMREESAFAQLPFEFRKAGPQLVLDLSIDLNPILHHNQPLQVGITSVIQTLDESETYWALAHPGQRADFHLRESFVKQL